MAVSRITKEDLKLRLEGDEAGRPALADVRRKYAWDHSTLKLPGAVRLDPKAPSTAGLSKDRDLVVYDSDPDEITGVEVAAGLAAGRIPRPRPEGRPARVGRGQPADGDQGRRPRDSASGSSGACACRAGRRAHRGEGVALLAVLSPPE